MGRKFLSSGPSPRDPMFPSKRVAQKRSTIYKLQNCVFLHLVSSDSSHEERKQQQHAPPDYDDVPAEPVNIQGVRISVVQDDDDADQGITKL